MRRAVIALAVVFAVAQDALAQRIVPDSGSKIRVRSAETNETSEGKLISLSADSLVYSPYFASGTKSLSMTDVRSLEVSRGLQRSNRAVFIGTGLGALAGVGITALLASAANTGDGPPGSLAAANLAPFLVGGGMVAGALLGARHRSEAWSPVRSPNDVVGVLIGPAARGTVVIGVTIPFGGADVSASAGASSR